MPAPNKKWSKMQQRVYSYRLDCTKEQRKQLSKSAGCARYVYNYAVKLMREAHEEGKKLPSCTAIDKMLPGLKKARSWLKEPHSQLLQQALIDLRRALQAYFKDKKRKVGFPNFRKRGKSDSCRFPQNVRVEDGKVLLPKIGWVAMRYSRCIEGRIKQATVKRSGQHWYVHIVCQVDRVVEKVKVEEGKAVGIDLGLLSFASLSNGMVIPNPKYLAQAIKKLKRYQRAYTRTKKGSKNREKARIKLARQYERVKNRRKDFLHKLTTMLVKNHDLIAIEDLLVKGMMQNRKLARAIADVGWYTFKRYLTYKCEWYGKHLVIIDRFMPTSKQCSWCKNKQDMPLSVRFYRCKSCGLELDRDINASINIRAAGISAFIACGERPLGSL